MSLSWHLVGVVVFSKGLIFSKLTNVTNIWILGINFIFSDFTALPAYGGRPESMYTCRAWLRDAILTDAIPTY